MNKLNSKIPEAPLDKKWDKHKLNIKLVSLANKKKLEIIVVGTGLAGSSAASSLAELGYNVKVFCFQDSPRRAHSIAAQGGINAAKNYQNDNDSVSRLFYDTIKGGDFRAREANTYRLAQLSGNIIDQSVAQGVPFARDYAGYLDNRSFGGALVSRTFYAKGQTGQQLLLGAYGALNRQIHTGKIKMYPNREMLDLVTIDGKARGIIVRNLITGKTEKYGAHAVVIASGGYANVFCLSTNAMGSNAGCIWQTYKKGAFFSNPCFVQIHPSCIPVHGEQQSKLTLMSESLRNDGRIWVPKDKTTAEKLRKSKNPALETTKISDDQRDYYLERRYPAYGNLVPRDLASRAAKERCDAGFGVNTSGDAVFLDFRNAIKKLGKKEIAKRYGNLFEMYHKLTDDNPYEVPMQIYPAAHYTMGGSWVDYNLMTTIPGLYSIGEANFSDHGANRLGASALMQGLADGYFILPYTIGDYLSNEINTPVIDVNSSEFDEAAKNVENRINKLLSINGSKTVDFFHKELYKIMWDYVGISRNKQGLEKAAVLIKKLKTDFWEEVKIPRDKYTVNQELEKAGRVADFIELAELITKDALNRNESCGGHFREEFQTAEGEALRNDDTCAYVSAWEYKGENKEPIMHKENLTFENIHLSQRSYK